jgi:hypothetical protein
VNGRNIVRTDGIGGSSVALASLRLRGRAETDSACRISVGLKDAIESTVGTVGYVLSRKMPVSSVSCQGDDARKAIASRRE